MAPTDPPLPIDPRIQRQVEEFQRQIAQSGQFYKDAFKALSADRVMKDLEALYRPPQPRDPLLRPAVDAGKAAAIWALDHLNPRSRRRSSGTMSTYADPDRVPPVVIDGTYIVITDVTNMTKQATASPPPNVAEAGSGDAQAVRFTDDLDNAVDDAHQPTRDAHRYAADGEH